MQQRLITTLLRPDRTSKVPNILKMFVYISEIYSCDICIKQRLVTTLLQPDRTLKVPNILKMFVYISEIYSCYICMRQRLVTTLLWPDRTLKVPNILKIFAYFQKFTAAIYTHYYNSNLIRHTVSRLVCEVIPLDHPRRIASRVIQWYGLIHKTWYCTPDQVTFIIICLLYTLFLTLFWFY